jgi:hypothetical protein
MPPVTVRVTGIVTGTSFIVPYGHTRGLQKYPAGHLKAGQPVLYSIDKYQMVVVGGRKYDVVRFGLQNDGRIVATRVSDAGLSAPHTVHPSWVPGYSPHSFQGGPYAGAWRILAGRGFLIHEGADSRVGQVGGSLGCVEVLDGGWPTFMDELKAKCGVPWPTISKHRLMKLVVERANYPTASLII